jgi:hypothetical protein
MRAGANKRSLCSWPRPPARRQRCTPAHGATPGARSPSPWRSSSPASACSASAWRFPTPALPLTGPLNQPRIGQPRCDSPPSSRRREPRGPRDSVPASGQRPRPIARPQRQSPAETAWTGRGPESCALMLYKRLRWRAPAAARGQRPRSWRPPSVPGIPARTLRRWRLGPIGQARPPHPRVGRQSPCISWARVPAKTESRARSSAPGKSHETP